MATEANQSVDTGNRIYVMAKNHQIGRAQSLTADRNYGTEGVYELGTIMPKEHVYLKYTGTLALERFRMVADNLASQSMQIAALGEDILQKDIITINVIDSVTKAVIESFYGCTASSYNTSYRANQICSETINFFYLDSSVTPQG